ncbi:helix-turn-helix domain-containing protein [Chryseobacterium tructae]|uniref:Helix-turn-helix domain-containing protein n=1 Tax=Chryseobacterium tructae TaxID=1037380 RepID=A0ABV7Y1H0_9FLAO|nr:helix-turn-helix domain-containing protein [Chryseobacterium tructae]MDN3694802.1 helix-turn-helix domain-containing protein [Chryseobacterium tructae]
MSIKILNISEFCHYLNVDGLKSDDLHIIDFDGKQEVRLKSEPVAIDFYLLAIKPPLDNRLAAYQLLEDQSASSYMYVDCPQNTLEWEIAPPLSGYTILVSAKYLEKYAKDYNFVHYNNHEALFLTKEEEIIVWDLFRKANHEFQKEYYSRTVIISYVNLILTYVKDFYDRQFDTRSDIYHRVIDEFYKNLDHYFIDNENLAGLPSVSYFAQKSNLSPNYFGDLIKHFTGKSPLDHIHDYVVKLAKDKLKNTSLSISEISYSLGFDYPNYFARFFRKKTGLSPKVFRNQ